MATTKWKIRKADPDATQALIDAGMSPPAAAIMATRGMAPADVARFLNPVLVSYLPKMHEFPGLREAGVFLADAIQSKRRIGIWTDYDCDGATSGATLHEFLAMCGVAPHRVHVPDRITEGYGPNRPGLERLFSEGVERMFVLDSGTVAVDTFNPMADDLRRNIVVIDHHLPGDSLPLVHAIVNPNRTDQAPGYGQMCAAGVTFLTCLSALTELNRRKHPWPGNVEPRMSSLLDLVAIGTVADVVPLVGINRAIVHQGLKMMADPRNMRPSVKALLDVARAKKVTTYEIGFVLGPRINATGRIGTATDGVNFLIERDPKVLAEMAKLLDDTNIERKRLEKIATDEGISNLGTPDPDGRDVIVTVADAHVGVVGISAARIKERFKRPTIVVAPDGNGKLKGSARSIEGFNIGEAIHHAADLGLIVQGGGHAMAGGVTLLPEQLDRFRAYMTEQSLASEFGRNGAVETFDAEIRPGHVREALEAAFGSLEPCGTGNPGPRLVMNNLRVKSVSTIGKDPAKRHLTFEVSSDGEDGCVCLLFNVDVSGQSEQELMLRSGRPIALAGKLSRNEFRGNVEIRFMVDEISYAFTPDPEPEVSGVEP